METAAEQEALVHWLASPDAYSSHPDSVEHIETHISHVFLAGEYVYKLKKPVQYDFLDFTSIATREHACREEVRLNRRLAPDAYLGVVPIVRDSRGAYQLAGTGEVVDWAVKMRRLPTELSLDTLHLRGELRPDQIDRLATTLVRFYQSLPPLSLTPHEYRNRCLSHVHGNLRELLAVKHHLPRGVVERVHGFQLQLLLLCTELFDARVQTGKIVDGHGDLRPEHICLSDPPEIFDCIEFNPDFRCIDVADELAFLAAECDFLGANWVGPQLMRAYQARSSDQFAPVLLDFYKSYRSCVRAKVAALRADQLQGPPQEAAVTEAHRHLAIADDYANAGLRPLVIAIGGLSGTGKTTLATALAEAFGAELLRTDIIRREIFASGSRPVEADSGIYQPAARERVYDELFQRAAALHADRVGVVLDGTFSQVDLLLKARDLAAHPHSVFLAIECICRREVAHGRMAQRLTDARDASDAHPEIHDIQSQRWETWPANVAQFQVDSEQPLHQQVESVIAALTKTFQAHV